MSCSHSRLACYSKTLEARRGLATKSDLRNQVINKFECRCHGSLEEVDDYSVESLLECGVSFESLLITSEMIRSAEMFLRMDIQSWPKADRVFG